MLINKVMTARGHQKGILLFPMAIYSCNLASIGRTTHATGTAGAHLRYIARDGANPIVQVHQIPLDASAARTWMDREEAASRKNARVADKIRIAIPRELDDEQRLALVRDFVEELTGNRVPWMFAIHQDGKDAHNPHAHIVVRDRDLETGKRVLRISDSARDRIKAGLEPKAVEWIRREWEVCANEALERAGHDERIDRRTLEAQGIDRAPTIHIGPQGEQVDTHVQRPRSKKRTTGTGREIDYPSIDDGRTRKERNAEIIDLNLERDARSPQFETRAWALFEQEQITLDRILEAELAEGTRRRTIELRDVRREFRAEQDAVRGERHHLLDQQAQLIRITYGAKKQSLLDRQRRERVTLQRRQKSLLARVVRSVDFTGRVRKRHEADRRLQIVRHKSERGKLSAQRAAVWGQLKGSIEQSYAPSLRDVAQRRRSALAKLRAIHAHVEREADALRQEREAEREQARTQTAEIIRQSKATMREPSTLRDEIRQRRAQDRQGPKLGR